MAGHIDVAKPGCVEGWAYDPADPDYPIEIEVCVDGRRVASCVADTFRQDLLDAGIGNGAHGFRIDLPAALMTRNILEVREVKTANALEGSPVNLVQTVVENTETGLPNLLIDVTDLIWHMDRYENMTGIPRVGAELIEAIFQYGLYDLGKITFVTVAYHAHIFEKVSTASFMTLLDCYKKKNNPRMVKKEDNLFHIEHYLEFIPFKPDKQFLAKSVMLAPGSSVWGIQHYFSLIRQFGKKGMKFIPLFHDMIPLTEPELTPPEMNNIFNMFIRKALRAAAHILTVSRHCAQDIADYAREIGYACPPLTAIGNGGNTCLESGDELLFAEPYVLSVGTIERRKNHLLLARVWKKLLAKYGDKTPLLVLVGKFGRDIKALLDLLKESDFLGQKVKILNNVSDSGLDSLYKNCLFTAYPSYYEGWGLPVSESLAYGKACLCSSASALPEAGGDFCVYFNPHDLNDCYAKAETLILDTARRMELETRIALEYKPVTWQMVAEKALDVVKAEGAKEDSPILHELPAKEYVFWQPVQLDGSSENDMVDMLQFGEGILSQRRLYWDNYSLADEMIIGGTWGNRDANGILAEQGFIKLEFKPDSSIPLENMQLLIAVAGEAEAPEFTLNISQNSILLLRQRIRHTGIIRLHALKYYCNGIIRIMLASETKQPFYIQSLSIFSAANPDSILDACMAINSYSS